MGKNDIRLRRQRLTARGSERFRNYNSVLKRHEENQRIRKIIRVFGFFAVLLIIIMLITMLSRWEQRAQPEKINYINKGATVISQIQLNQGLSSYDQLP